MLSELWVIETSVIRKDKPSDEYIDFSGTEEFVEKFKDDFSKKFKDEIGNYIDDIIDITFKVSKRPFSDLKDTMTIADFENLFSIPITNDLIYSAMIDCDYIFLYKAFSQLMSRFINDKNIEAQENLKKFWNKAIINRKALANDQGTTLSQVTGDEFDNFENNNNIIEFLINVEKELISKINYMTEKESRNLQEETVKQARLDEVRGLYYLLKMKELKAQGDLPLF